MKAQVLAADDGEQKMKSKVIAAMNSEQRIKIQTLVAEDSECIMKTQTLAAEDREQRTINLSHSSKTMSLITLVKIYTLPCLNVHYLQILIRLHTCKVRTLKINLNSKYSNDHNQCKHSYLFSYYYF